MGGSTVWHHGKKYYSVWKYSGHIHMYVYTWKITFASRSPQFFRRFLISLILVFCFFFCCCLLLQVRKSDLLVINKNANDDMQMRLCQANFYSLLFYNFSPTLLYSCVVLVAGESMASVSVIFRFFWFQHKKPLC